MHLVKCVVLHPGEEEEALQNYCDTLFSKWLTFMLDDLYLDVYLRKQRREIAYQEECF